MTHTDFTAEGYGVMAIGIRVTMLSCYVGVSAFQDTSTVHVAQYRLCYAYHYPSLFPLRFLESLYVPFESTMFSFNCNHKVTNNSVSGGVYPYLQVTNNSVSGVSGGWSTYIQGTNNSVWSVGGVSGEWSTYIYIQGTNRFSQSKCATVSTSTR